MTLWTVLLMGLLLGTKHATEADHLAAVAILVTGGKSLGQAVTHGVAWGVGHTLTLSLFGGIMLAIGSRISDDLARGLELAVGVMLIGLGVDVLYRLFRRRIHFHTHTHDDGVTHMHFHSHAADGLAGSSHAHRHSSALPIRAALVGMMHGMAGSAALIVLSLETVRSPLIGCIYIAAFGVGSIAGMALLSIVIAWPMQLSARRLARVHAALMTTVGVASGVVGAVIVYRQALA